MGACCAQANTDQIPLDGEFALESGEINNGSKQLQIFDFPVSGSESPTKGGSGQEMKQTRKMNKMPTQSKNELDKIAAARGRGHREGVSAAVVTSFQMDNFVKPVYAKSPEEEAALQNILQTNQKMQVICPDLSGEALKDVINAFFPKVVMQGEDVIRQSAEGDCLFICEQGELDIFVNRADASGNMPAGKGGRVLTVGPGALFGELALMYSAPRAATVTVSSSEAKLWALDGDAFKMLIINNTSEKMDLYEGYLQEVEILKPLNKHELSQIAGVMESTLYDDQEDIFKQGEIGDAFYIVEDGTCSAYMDGPSGEKEVAQYETGDYFGEIALLTNEPRRASVRATGEGCTVASFTKEEFDSLFGPIRDNLQANVSEYQQYAKYV